MRWLTLRQNSLLRQPVAAWRFRRNEVLMLLQARRKKWMGVKWTVSMEDSGLFFFFGCIYLGQL